MGKKPLVVVLVALACVLALAGVAAALYVNSLGKALSFQDEEAESRLKEALYEPVPEAAAEPYYVLLLGSDARAGDTVSRSDVIILTRVDEEAGRITMVSIPRDTMVDLPGYGRSKMNAAYAYGGAAGAVEAVSNFAGVPITHYAEIHFEELVELVDSLGGVRVNVPVSNNQTGSSNTGMRLEAGEQLLSGEEALALARERYGYARGDFQRADNQKLIAQAIVNQVLDVSPLELPGVVQDLAKCVTTDYSLADLVSLAQSFQEVGETTFHMATVPSSTMTLDSVSYVVTDQAAWTQMMEMVDRGADPNAEPAAEAAGEGAEGEGDGTADSDGAPEGASAES